MKIHEDLSSAKYLSRSQKKPLNDEPVEMYPQSGSGLPFPMGSEQRGGTPAMALETYWGV
jgi:hypothetical protein